MDLRAVWSLANAQKLIRSSCSSCTSAPEARRSVSMAYERKDRRRTTRQARAAPDVSRGHSRAWPSQPCSRATGVKYKGKGERGRHGDTVQRAVCATARRREHTALQN